MGILNLVNIPFARALLIGLRLLRVLFSMVQRIRHIHLIQIHPRKFAVHLNSTIISLEVHTTNSKLIHVVHLHTGS